MQRQGVVLLIGNCHKLTSCFPITFLCCNSTGFLRRPLMVLAHPSEVAEISFQLFQSHPRCLCSSGFLRPSFLPLLNLKGSITYRNSSLGAGPWAVRPLALCLHKGKADTSSPGDRLCAVDPTAGLIQRKNPQVAASHFSH